MIPRQELIERKYEFLEHTADTKFRAYGFDLKEAFANAAVALFETITTVKKISPEKKKIIKITAKNEQALLYDFLEELIFFIDTEDYLLSKVESIKIIEKQNIFKLEAVLLGDGALDYEVHGAIKAMTYNDMEIIKEDNFVAIQVVLDL